jgi:hypothetical protein
MELQMLLFGHFHLGSQQDGGENEQLLGCAGAGRQGSVDLVAVLQTFLSSAPTVGQNKLDCLLLSRISSLIYA